MGHRENKPVRRRHTEQTRCQDAAPAAMSAVLRDVAAPLPLCPDPAVASMAASVHGPAFLSARQAAARHALATDLRPLRLLFHLLPHRLWVGPCHYAGLARGGHAVPRHPRPAECCPAAAAACAPCVVFRCSQPRSLSAVECLDYDSGSACYASAPPPLSPVYVVPLRAPGRLLESSCAAVPVVPLQGQLRQRQCPHSCQQADTSPRMRMSSVSPVWSTVSAAPWLRRSIAGDSSRRALLTLQLLQRQSTSTPCMVRFKNR